MMQNSCVYVKKVSRLVSLVVKGILIGAKGLGFDSRAV